MVQCRSGGSPCLLSAVKHQHMVQILRAKCDLSLECMSCCSPRAKPRQRVQHRMRQSAPVMQIASNMLRGSSVTVHPPVNMRPTKSRICCMNDQDPQALSIRINSNCLPYFALLHVVPNQHDLCYKPREAECARQNTLEV